ncbi:hypothetical protein KDU71_15605 [Carboxylicivirga sediminis]|uniref:Bacteriophage abortive infection AbiH n=1 Tax=Carboxylicivirga sediminis TaxID=2006564 RepID=A0A941IYV7_9BACT|nr:AbiH family protein [Carboxylicivirga sediminis]MBR8536998.1 hypothetical protein [Carboxylicivirga sediminis]
MNRLIIIGNGFDLAHGIKSSFKDFILSYLSYAINTFNGSHSYEDDLISIRLNSMSVYPRLQDADNENVLELLKFISRNEYVDIVQSNFLINILQDIENQKWVDLEVLYFKQLFRFKHISHTKELNLQFECLRKHLIKYLSENSKTNTHSLTLVESFTKSLNINNNQPHMSDALYFLNFNYTPTLDWYLNQCEGNNPISLNYIHGSLCGKHGQPIFGYGDELNTDYQELEKKEENEPLRFIKSFAYLQNQNYDHLMGFIESRSFEVHIYGHSCGLSDRTLLNTIFKHDHCRRIKIFYHEWEVKGVIENDFTTKIFNIARHFTNPKVFRKKVVNFKNCVPMPQPISELEKATNPN